MLDNNKKILETIAKAVPEMDEFDKGYLLGMGEALIKKKSEIANDSEQAAESEQKGA